MDLFVVPTVSFRLLNGLLILRHDRRRLLWLGATTHPTAEWIAQQLVEACGWYQAPRYLVRDRDQSYGEAFVRRVRAMGIRDRPTSPQSPWQNGYAERLIGSVRRECIDHVIALANGMAVGAARMFCRRNLFPATRLNTTVIARSPAAQICVVCTQAKGTSIHRRHVRQF